MSKQKQRKRGKRKQATAIKRRPAMLVANRPSGRMLAQLNQIIDLIDDHDFEEAERRLHRLDGKGNYAKVAELMVSLYQRTQDSEKEAEAALRWMRLEPNSPDAWVCYAQGSMLCGRACLAMVTYQDFIERFPNHKNVDRAKSMLELLVPEAEDRVKRAGLDPADGARLFADHELAVMHLGNAQFQEVVDICKRLCVKAPHFISPRNNWALAVLYQGNLREATRIAEETRKRFPDNYFVACTLAKLYFMAFRCAEAEAIADDLVANPPVNDPDAFVACLESLALLGRDREIIEVCKHGESLDILDPKLASSKLHYLAYAQYRVGEKKLAHENWRGALKAMPNHPTAAENLEPTEEHREHVPWADSIQKWIPKEVIERHILGKEVLPADVFAHIVSTVLDRGDPTGRTIYLELAKRSSSPQTLEALRAFALGERGPVKMRMQALAAIKERGLVDAGPHRVFVNGKYTDIALATMEIHGEAENQANKEFVRLMERGHKAMQAGDLDEAERCFKESIDLEPDVPKGHYNLATVWLYRGGSGAQKRAREIIESIRNRFPGYVFAEIAMAQFAAMDGDVEGAIESIRPLFQRERLHYSEAKALYCAAIQIELDQGETEKAKAYMVLLRQAIERFDIADMPMLESLQRKIDRSERKRPFSF
ncbi:MAG: hypothetical protein R3C05_31110 [Pirellulaceae bacterium]